MSFYVIVLIIAIIILIITLASVGVLLKKIKTNQVFPPSASRCPDYWTIDSKGYCIVPNGENSMNVPSVGYLTDTVGLYNGVVDFNDASWNNTGSSALCAKNKWANKYSVHWGGVSNYNSC
jgi:hypothetical protein